MNIQMLLLTVVWVCWAEQEIDLVVTEDGTSELLEGSNGPRPSLVSFQHRIFFMDEKDVVFSPWHDLDLRSSTHNGCFHFVNEIPKGTRAKNEVATTEPFNPIKQDRHKDNQLRFFTYDNIPFNYGMMPQTWEMPKALGEVSFIGDNDPLDVVELGFPLAVGDVIAVKVLGILGMIDDGEMDWKVVAIRADDPMANTWNDISDVDEGIRTAIFTWFQMYKTSDGKPKNEFLNDGKFYNKAYAEHIIAETHASWEELVTEKVDQGNLHTPRTHRATDNEMAG